MRSVAMGSDGGPRGPFHGKTPLTAALRLRHAKIAWCPVTQTLANVWAIWQQGGDHNIARLEGKSFCPGLVRGSFAEDYYCHPVQETGRRVHASTLLAVQLH